MVGGQLIDFGAQGTGGTHPLLQQAFFAQNGGQAGFPPGQQLGESGRVCGGEVDVHIVNPVKVEHRVRAGVDVHLFRPAFQPRRWVEAVAGGVKVRRQCLRGPVGVGCRCGF